MHHYNLVLVFTEFRKGNAVTVNCDSQVKACQRKPGRIKLENIWFRYCWQERKVIGGWELISIELILGADSEKVAVAALQNNLKRI